MSDINPDVLRKIKKCLALATSDNPGEAENALRQAQKLMTLHGVTASALDRSAVKSLRVRGTRGSKPAVWETTLVWACCRAFGAHPLWASGPKGGYSDAHNGWWTFIAPESNVELVVYAYTVLVRPLVKTRHEHSNRLGWAGTRVQKAAELDAFCEAYADRLYLKVQPIGLTEAQRAAIEAEAASQRDPDGKRVMPTNNGEGSFGARFDGAAAGDKAQFHKATAGPADQLKLGATPS